MKTIKQLNRYFTHKQYETLDELRIDLEKDYRQMRSMSLLAQKYGKMTARTIFSWLTYFKIPKNKRGGLNNDKQTLARLIAIPETEIKQMTIQQVANRIGTTRYYISALNYKHKLDLKYIGRRRK